MPSPLTLAKISLRQQAADHLIEVDRQRDLAGSALEAQDTSAAAAHLANIARAARQCSALLQALSESQRSAS